MFPCQRWFSSLYPKRKTTMPNMVSFIFIFSFSLKEKKKKNNQGKKKFPEKSFFHFFFHEPFFFSCDFFFSNQPTLFFFSFFFQEQSVLSLLNLLQGLQRESKDCKKDHYKNKTRKPNNTKMPSLVSVTISLKQIRRLPGARRSHFDVCFPGHNGGPVVPQHLDTAPAN